LIVLLIISASLVLASFAGAVAWSDLPLALGVVLVVGALLGLELSLRVHD
jgi:hypothetical protein